MAKQLTPHFHLVIPDLPGWGESSRDMSANYDIDAQAARLQAFVQTLGLGRFLLVGHSMGGAILLMQAHGGRSPFARIVATAPMIDIHGLRMPRAARLLAETLDGLGLGGAFIPGGKPLSIMAKPFRNNPLTADPRRYARNAALVAADPMLALGDPTVSWAHAAFRLIDAFADPEYPRRIQTPALIYSAGADRVVETRAVERFASRLKAGKLIPIPFCEHEILQERDAIRSQFWAAFDAFVPGSAAPVDSAEEAAPKA